LANQTITWTAIPNQILQTVETDVATISVFISPRLFIVPEEGTLESFPTFWNENVSDNWPAKIRHFNFSIIFSDNPMVHVEATLAESSTSLLDSTLWSQLFKKTTPVISNKPDDYTNGYVVKSFSVKEIYEPIKDIYKKVIHDFPLEHPKIQSIEGLLAQMAPVSPVEYQFKPEAELKDEIENMLKQIKALSYNQFPQPPKGNFVALGMYYEEGRPKKSLLPKRGEGPVSKAVAKAYEDVFDFHEILSALSEYPIILRKLGLIIDLNIPASQIPDSFANNPKWLKISVSPESSDYLYPNTRYLYDGEASFKAAPLNNQSKAATRGPNIVNGMLEFNNTLSYFLYQTDVDGAALKLKYFADNHFAQFAESVNAIDKEKAKDKQSSIPTLRSGSIAVARIDRAVSEFMPRINKQKEFSDTIGSGSDLHLYAQDLAHGYRIDIWDCVSQTWNSLCERKGKYDIYGDLGNPGLVTNTFEFSDEGWTQTGVTQTIDEKDPGTPDEPDKINLNLHEDLFKWDGWSLCAPRPGKPIDINDKIEKVTNDPVTKTKLKTTFVPKPKTLPRLRFGREYRIRARIVDLAGNGLTKAEAGINQATPAPGLKYLRFEPVSAPVLILRHALDPETRRGESLHHMVIRSPNSNMGKDSERCVDSSERHVAPPKTSQLMAEAHGMFDGSHVVKGDTTTYELISTRDKKGNSFEVNPPLPPEPDPTLSEAEKNAANEARSKEISEKEHFPIFEQDQAVVPYLPDPMSAGALIQIPIANLKSPIRIHCDFKPKGLESTAAIWPNLIPFRLKVQEPDKDDKNIYRWLPDEAHTLDRLLLLNLPKATTMKLKISSYFDKSDPRLSVKNMGLLNWLRESPDIAPNVIVSDEKVKQAEDGLMPMITPATEVTIVHAVQQPLGRPQLSFVPTVQRKVGDTVAHLAGIVDVHTSSTLKVDVSAKWEDPLDNGTNSDPENAKLKNNVNAFVIDPITKDKNGFEKDHYFNDTKYHAVTYHCISTSRFREYYPNNTEGGFTRESDVNTDPQVHILNSIAPHPPKIFYIVPTFKWSPERSETKLGNELKRTRAGGGLRVYMDRPWYSSGQGELLGVVLFSGQMSKLRITEEPERYCTLWGNDPIWGGDLLTLVNPTPDKFTNKANVENAINDVLLQETLQTSDLTKIKLRRGVKSTVAQSVKVVGHEVHFDPVRQLWYSDIEIDAGMSYSPFIRLALVRYQPHSVKGCHISRVVMADFSQLTPNRSLSIIRAAPNLHVLKIKVSGVSYKNRVTYSYIPDSPDGKKEEYTEETSEGKSKIEVAVERLNPNFSSKPDFGWEAAPDVIIQNDNLPNLLWSGTVTLPVNVSGQRYRLMVKEFEILLTDSKDYSIVRDAQINRISSSDLSEVGRIIYSDIVEL